MTRENVVFVDVIQVKRWSFVWWKLHHVLVLFGIIFEDIFDFIFLAFEQYHVVDPFMTEAVII